MLEVATETATAVGNVVEGSLQHAMLRQNRAEIQAGIASIAEDPQIANLFLLNPQSRVTAATTAQSIGRQFTLADDGCRECHAAGSPHQHQFSVIINVADVGRVLRNCNPVENRESCHQCHDPAQPYTGVLITDLGLTEIEEHAARDLRRTLLLLASTLVAGAVLLGLSMERAIADPVGQLTQAIRDFDQGNLGRRAGVRSDDEIGEMAQAFNRMADGLEQKAILEEKVRERTQELQALYSELQEKEALREQLLKQVINAQEDERKRVARELHDELAQTLTSLLMSLDATEGVLEPELESVRRQLARTRDITQRALQQTRGLILDLRPTMLDDLGLVSAIRWYVEHRLESSDLVATVKTRGEQRRLPSQTETALFRITQEAVNNIAKHAAATRANIELIWESGSVIVKISDDGQGFDPDTAMDRRDEAQGMGLLGMKERATLLGGSLDILSEPGEGTMVVVKLPTRDGADTDVSDPSSDS
jgi:signal transduction histidine kinase